MSTITGCVEMITPESAKAMIKNSHITNRKLTGQQMAFANDMRAGKWRLNGEPIVIDENGNVRDGYHRLQAVISADIPVEFYVIRGIPENEATIYDRGSARTETQSFIMEGKDQRLYNAKNVSIAKLIISMKYKNTRMTRSRAILEDVLDNNKNTFEAIRTVISCNKSKSAATINSTTSPFGAAYFYAYGNGVPIEKIKLFADIVYNGVSTSDTQISAQALRNDLLSGKIGMYAGEQQKRLLCRYVQMALEDFNNGRKANRIWSYTRYANRNVWSDSENINVK